MARNINRENMAQYIEECAKFAKSYRYFNDDDELQLVADVLRLEEAALAMLDRLNHLHEMLEKAHDNAEQ